MKIRPLTSHPLAQRGFTLIELLVVISIIAVLAGLLFPAMGAVRTSARKASAANDCMQIVNAVKNFYTDYGKYPVPAGSDYASTTSNKAVIDELRMPSSFTPVSNTRKIRYLEVKEAKVGADASTVRSAVDNTGVWKDPWMHAYLIFIDGNYDGSIEVKDVGDKKTPFNAVYEISVAAASHGPSSGKESDAAPGSKYTSPIGSWK